MDSADQDDPGLRLPNHRFSDARRDLVLGSRGRTPLPRRKAFGPTGAQRASSSKVITALVNDMAEGMIGHGGRQYVPLLATMFTFILFANLVGLLPGFTPPTGNIGTTLGLGIVSFLAYNYYGFREHGVSYLKQFAGPVIWLAPLMAVVEVLSHVFRPVSLAIRLFGNMFADHLVLGIFTDLTKVVIPIAFYTLGAFVCVLQAFVFTVLSIVYIALAVGHTTDADRKSELKAEPQTVAEKREGRRETP
jgi:F-type H+-transporting ATPase subunit a